MTKMQPSLLVDPIVVARTSIRQQKLSTNRLHVLAVIAADLPLELGPGLHQKLENRFCALSQIGGPQYSPLASCVSLLDNRQGTLTQVCLQEVLLFSLRTSGAPFLMLDRPKDGVPAALGDTN